MLLNERRAHGMIEAAEEEYFSLEEYYSEDNGG